MTKRDFNDSAIFVQNITTSINHINRCFTYNPPKLSIVGFGRGRVSVLILNVVDDVSTYEVRLYAILCPFSPLIMRAFCDGKDNLELDWHNNMDNVPSQQKPCHIR